MVRPLPPGRLVLASHNTGKLAEFRTLFAPFPGHEIVSAGELGLPEPDETATTFEGNAELKALAAATASGLPALSDDSGLCVTALGGDPGIYSARWAGPDKDFSRAMRMVDEGLQKAGATTPEARGAFFVAVLALAWPDGHVDTFRGEVHGDLVWPPRGSRGFGYDPMFRPEGLSLTFGEIEADDKHGVAWSGGRGTGLSHRARAFVTFADACLAGAGPDRIDPSRADPKRAGPGGGW